MTSALAFVVFGLLASAGSAQAASCAGLLPDGAQDGQIQGIDFKSSTLGTGGVCATFSVPASDYDTGTPPPISPTAIRYFTIFLPDRDRPPSATNPVKIRGSGLNVSCQGASTAVSGGYDVVLNNSSCALEVRTSTPGPATIFYSVRLIGGPSSGNYVLDTGTITGGAFGGSEPAISSIAPAEGSSAGGTTVTINGSNLTGALAVSFGGRAATSVTVVNNTRVTAVAPAHAAGAVDVAVTTPYGTATQSNGYTYFNPPAIATLFPAFGPPAGRTFVTMLGANFTGTTMVTFGGVAATNIAVLNDATLTLTTPAHAAGAVDVVVTARGGTDTATFTYAPPLSAATTLPSKVLTVNTAVAAFTPVTGSGGAGALNYSVLPELPTGLSLNPATGEITGMPSATQTPTVYTVTVKDTVNATATAAFSLAVNSAVVATQSIGSVVATANRAVTAFRPVTGVGGTGALTYGVSPELPAGLTFASTNGQISGTPTVAQIATTYTVTVTDTNGSAASATFSLTVNSAVAATQSVPSAVATANHALPPYVPVTGSGGTGSLTYSISPELPTGLSLSPTSGAVSGTPTFATSQVYTVTVTDINGATASTTFTLIVSGAPIATQAIATKTLTADAAATPFIPVVGGGGSSPLTYSVSPALPAGLSLSSTNGQISGTPSATLAPTTFTVTVTDVVGATASNSFVLAVNGAVIATQSIGSVVATANHAVTAFRPVTGSGGTSPLTYGVSPALPTGLTFDSTNGQISGTPTAAQTATTYTVTVTDINGTAATATFSLTVNGVVTATQSIGSVVATANRAVTTFTPVTGSGGTSPLAYGVSPALPTGLSLSLTSGAVSGTPTVAQTATTYTVTVTDTNGAAASATFSLTVNSAIVATQDTASIVATQDHTLTTVTPVTGSGGTGSLTYSVSPALPAGLSLSLTSGAVSGTPTTAQTATAYTVTVTDTNGATATASFSLTVNSAVAAAQEIATKALTVDVAAAPFTPVTGSGGTTPLSYSISPALPSGLTLSTADGEISGTPTTTEAPTTYTVTVTDANGATAANTFVLAVNSAVAATQAVPSTTLTVGAAPTPFTPVTGSGGTGSLSYGVSPGLPAGLSFNTSTGQITGTPAASETSTTHTVTVTDANGATATATFLLTVNSAVTATADVPSRTLTVGAPATPFIPVVGAGGTGTLAYAVSPSLPAGLSFNSSSGQITGTPSAIQSAVSYTVTVTDINNATATASFSLTVNNVATSTTLEASAQSGLIGQPIVLNATVSPSASVGTVTFQDGSSVLCATVAVVSGNATCNTSFSSAGVHNVVAVYSGGGSYAGSTSTALQVSITDQTAKTVETIGGFMRRRNDLIASNAPDANRQIDRLNQARGASSGGNGSRFADSSTFGVAAPSRIGDAAGPGSMARYLGGDLGRSLRGRDPAPLEGGREDSDAGSIPVRISAGSDGPAQFGFATSLSEIMHSNAQKDRAKVASALGYGAGLPEGEDAVPFVPFDIWLEGKYSSFRDHEESTGLDGHFGLFTLGADYVVSPSLLLGAYVQFDTMRERDDEKLTNVAGHGWMAGPYATVRLTDEIYWQVRAGWGRSSNEVSPFQTYVDSFDTTRWLLSSTLTGRWSYGAWQLSPSASVTYLDETSESYADTFGVLIPEVTNRLGQAKAGPEVAYRFQSISGATFEPHARMELVWNFADELSADGFGSIDDTAGPAGVRGRVELGLRAMSCAGIGFDITGSYDGIGSGAYSAITGQGQLSIPLN